MQSIHRLYESLASVASDNGTQKTLVTRASQLASARSIVSPDDSNETVRNLFNGDEGLEALAVVEQGRPIGLINRNIFMEQYARPFGRDVFGRKSCIAFMDKHPVMVDANTPIELLVKIAVDAGGKVMKDGFVTTEDGNYHGMGTGFALMQAMSDIEAEKTRQLLSSINYASLIQRSHLAESDQVLKARLPNHGLLWEPRDVVGGDAYFFRETPQGLVGCVFDCTGHGVPGAFMTLIALSFLEQTFEAQAPTMEPGEALTRMNRYIKRVLQQGVVDSDAHGQGVKESNDGLDAAIFILHPDRQKISYAAAKLPLMVINPSGDIEVIDGDKHGIGYHDTPADAQWATHEVTLNGSPLLCICTDGVIDQLGGPKNIAHGKRRLMQFLSERPGESASAVTRAFAVSFAEWQGRQRRRDDVSMLVFKPEH
jgi:serine phosphatase RsbU (regulator of sigma subunit)